MIARFHVLSFYELFEQPKDIFDPVQNMEKLSQTLTTLRHIYTDNRNAGFPLKMPNEAELESYRLLIELDKKFPTIFDGLPKDVQDSTFVQFAVAIYNALKDDNYVRFFQLARTANYLHSCLMMLHFNKIRARAIQIMSRSYRQYPLITFTNLLGFENVDHTADFVAFYGIAVNIKQQEIKFADSSLIVPDMAYPNVQPITLFADRRPATVKAAITKPPHRSRVQAAVTLGSSASAATFAAPAPSFRKTTSATPPSVHAQTRNLGSTSAHVSPPKLSPSLSQSRKTIDLTAPPLTSGSSRSGLHSPAKSSSVSLTPFTTMFGEPAFAPPYLPSSTTLPIDQQKHQPSAFISSSSPASTYPASATFSHSTSSSAFAGSTSVPQLPKPLSRSSSIVKDVVIPVALPSPRRQAPSTFQPFQPLPANIQHSAAPMQQQQQPQQSTAPVAAARVVFPTQFRLPIQQQAMQQFEAEEAAREQQVRETNAQQLLRDAATYYASQLSRKCLRLWYVAYLRARAAKQKLALKQRYWNQMIRNFRLRKWMHIWYTTWYTNYSLQARKQQMVDIFQSNTIGSSLIASGLIQPLQRLRLLGIAPALAAPPSPTREEHDEDNQHMYDEKDNVEQAHEDDFYDGEEEQDYDGFDEQQSEADDNENENENEFNEEPDDDFTFSGTRSSFQLNQNPSTFASPTQTLSTPATNFPTIFPASTPAVYTSVFYNTTPLTSGKKRSHAHLDEEDPNPSASANNLKQKAFSLLMNGASKSSAFGNGHHLNDIDEEHKEAPSEPILPSPDRRLSFISPFKQARTSGYTGAISTSSTIQQYHDTLAQDEVHLQATLEEQIAAERDKNMQIEMLLTQLERTVLKR